MKENLSKMSYSDSVTWKCYCLVVLSLTRSRSLSLIPPNKQMKVWGIDICSIAGGKIAKIWESYDIRGMMQQLGVK